MKKLITALIIVTVLASCCNTNDAEPKPIVKTTNAHLSVEYVDGCKYVLYSWNGAGGLTHAGDCENHK